MITNLQIGSYGRLGNQLFQFATAFNLAKKLNTELWLSSDSEANKTIGRYNPVIKSYDVYSNDLFRFFNLNFTKKIPRHTIEKEVKHFYKENNRVCFYPEVFELEDGTNLHGYFQGKEYVDLFEFDLRNELKLNDFYFNFGLEFLNNLKKNHNKIFSLHVRRGDSLPDNNSIYAKLSIENYYNKIIFENVDKNDIVLVFSDDIEWCKNNFSHPRIKFVDNRPDEYGHLKDFSIMSMCDVNIMSVSTYSWWTCWMNPLNKNKTVIMPNKWWGWSLPDFCEEIYRYDKWIKYNNE
jgi:hypothetical protein